MASTLHVTQSVNGAIDFNFGEMFSSLTGFLSMISSEVQKQTPIFSGGVAEDLKAKILSNTINGATVFVLRINGADGANTLSITASTSGLFEDTTHTDNISTTNKLNHKITPSGSSGSMVIASVSISFAATTNTAQLLTTSKDADYTVAASTQYYPINGGGVSDNLTEDNVEFVFQSGGTLRNGAVYISSNTSAVTTTYRSRIDGANGNLAIAVTAAATGLVQDTSNTDTIAAGNTVNWSASSAADAGDVSGKLLSAEFITTDTSWQSISGIQGGSGLSQAAGLTRYYIIGTNVTNPFTTETDAQTKTPFSFTASNLQIFITANAGTTNGSITLMEGGAETGLTASITALTTGLFVDNSNTYAVAADDLLSMRIVSGATAATVFSMFGFKARNSSATSLVISSTTLLGCG